ncbi:hypothetical protein [Pseudomonas fluorescens]|uniref:Transmembrane protein n=1 Tax=Pseudomonas fluorescens TaxID=294 RepID=A0A0F4VGU7_PSEFL|nr:hypothetical protein [Pseudomonas fluorescens]KJZ67247.1 hypothetical protein VD17_03010 [Pseudomonas fluorescens]
MNEVERVLGSPVGYDLSEPAAKTKRVVISLSIAMACLVLAKIEPGDQFSLAGITLKGITSYKLILGLLIALCWTYVHFGWYAVESFMEWRLRITGTKVAFVTTGMLASHNGDYPGDPKQSTLYNWWVGQARQMKPLGAKVDEIENRIALLKTEIDSPTPVSPGVAGVTERDKGFTKLENALLQLRHELMASTKAVESERIPASLARFDGWFRNLLTLQNVRVLVVDIAFPMVLGVAAIWLGVRYLIQA